MSQSQHGQVITSITAWDEIADQLKQYYGWIRFCEILVIEWLFSIDVYIVADTSALKPLVWSWQA